ncbi:formate dehydrogenase subunit alpha [Acidipila sp. EB88]|uniref:formate dehydrogenase subunit alpha n=1 Tax=Acidipila sp. EB88 TaxID=2305226 RepID=UPI001F284337|nr:formate dehydrogenase subunit alpha [Acidipila sp. EB88]
MVNGQPTKALVGERLIDALQRTLGGTKSEVPHVCYLPQLGPIQTCDTCFVEVNGELARACAAKVESDARIVTESTRARNAQKEGFDRILGNHLLYCTVCDNNNGNCTVHNTTALLEVEHQEHPFLPKPYEKDETNPFYRYDPDQCILCGRCVQACQDYQVNETLSINWEDPHPRVQWDGGHTIGGSSCVSCGHCITVCPCNALMEKSMLGEAGYLTNWPAKPLEQMIDLVKAIEPEMGYGPILKVSETEAAMRETRTTRTKTVCTYCGVGCSFDIWTKPDSRHILKVEPSQGAANDISTCVKGKFGWDYVNAPDRLQVPLIRNPDGETFREASWEEALTLIGSKMGQIKQEYGPDALGFIASSKTTNEENYLMQKLARAVVGTNNVDNCSRYCQSPATQGLFRTVGYGGDSGSIHDIGKASCVICIGTNTTESHPVLATRVKQAHKLRGQKLIVADIREHEMARRADIFFQPTPGTDIIWLTAMTKYILDSGLAKMDFIERWVNKLEEFRAESSWATMEFAAEKCGISIEELTRIARIIAAEESVCILWAMGVTQHVMGSDTSTAISNLLLATGNYMRPGTGAYPLRGHNNVQGASDFGCMPNMFPGYEHTDDEAAHERYEQGWGAKLQKEKGLDNHQMIDAVYDGKLRCIYLFGEDMYSADSNANHVAGGFERLDFFVVQDIFFSATCRFADVVLPASPSLEKEGTFTNTERRIQRLYEVFEPLGESRPDWRIIQDIANRLGAKWNYKHPSEIMHEAASLAPLFAGVRYDRLEGYKTLQWPVAIDGTDQPLLYTTGFPLPDNKAQFHPLKYRHPIEVEDDEFDLHLNNGRLLEHFHEGNMTYRVPGIKEETPDRWVEVSPELAKLHNLTTGQWVDITSRRATLRVPVLITDRVKGNQMFIPLNSPDAPVNLLTGSDVDDVTHTPAYKELAVKMKVLPWKGENPLKAINFRNGHPTPQNGVEVERKWKRADYRMPGLDPELVQISIGNGHNGNGAGKMKR